MVRVFINGLSTGLVLQLAIGPVFFFIVNLSMQRTIIDGVFSVVAVTLVDYFYIFLALVGVGKILEHARIKHVLGMLSAGVIFAFGMIMLLSVRRIVTDTVIPPQQVANYGSSFLSALLLTISSPLTMVFWTSLFASKALEYGYTRNQLTIFGVSAGLATLLFLGSTAVMCSVAKTSIPPILVTVLNAIVGVVLMLYGIIRFMSVVKQASPERGVRSARESCERTD